MRRRLVIIGAGLGGCTLAHALAEAYDVTLVERGLAPDARQPVVVDEGRPAITEPHVASGLGGTTSLWHNGLIEIDDAVFQRHWPISKEQLAPFYEQALPLLANGASRRALQEAIQSLSREYRGCGMPDMPYPGLYYPVWPINVWEAFKLQKRVRVIADEVTGLQCDAAGRVRAVSTLASGSVEGDEFVLAAGGLGTPALLQRLPALSGMPGLAHAGCHYEDHPMTFVGELQLDAPLYRLWNHAVPRMGGNLRLPLVVEREGLQVSFQLRPAATVSMSSRRQRVDTVLNDLRRQPWNPLLYLRVMRNPDDLLDILSFKFGVHLPTRHYTLLMVAQMPTRAERDVWADEGAAAPGAVVHRRWVLPEAYLAVLRAAIDDALRELGTLVQGVRLFDDWAANLRSAAHHSGTARMSSTPSDGVCDPDARVHGLANLYVCDGSLIPASGVANTGLTIAALALRLADHLRRRPPCAQGTAA
jgi:choline dehydrogenase-like flavoprotein